VCIDYSDEIAAGVYEQFQTQLLTEEVERVSDCRSKLNLQLYCSVLYHHTKGDFFSIDFPPIFFLKLFVFLAVLCLLTFKCFFFYFQIR